jgi:putative PIN family toxin of toxin-antitoxin system
LIWVVLDTNTLVSGMGWTGPPSEVLDVALQGRFTLLTSRPLLDELERVLSSPKLARHFRDPARLVEAFEAVAVVVAPDEVLHVVERDPADNRVLEAAQAGLADFIVTGDSDLLELGSFGSIRILDPADFLAVIRSA